MNKYIEEKLFSTQGYFYGVSEKVNNTFKVTIELDEEIDIEPLRYAVNKTSERYPYLMVRTKCSIFDIKLVHNDKPVLVKETKENVTLGSEETNYHLLALTFFENKIFFSVFHGIFDGSIMFEFLKTLLYYYFSKKHNEKFSTEGIRIVGDEITKEEYIDPLINIKNDDSPDLLKINNKIKNPLRLENDLRIKESFSYKYCVKMPEKELITYCKENDSSPASLFTLLMARAINVLNPNKTEPIIGALCHNLKIPLNVKNTCHSIVGHIFLEFDEKVKKLSYKMQNTIYRGRIILKSDRMFLRKELIFLYKFFNFVKMLPFLCLKKLIIKNTHFSNDNRNSTYLISYIGKFVVNGIEKHIKSIIIDVEAPKSNIFIEALSTNGYFFLNFMQEWKESLYFDAFCKEIENVGLTYELIEEGKLVTPLYSQ